MTTTHRLLVGAIRYWIVVDHLGRGVFKFECDDPGFPAGWAHGANLDEAIADVRDQLRLRQRRVQFAQRVSP